MEEKQIMILGVGNLLFTDEGVGVRVAEALQDRYDFPENVKVPGSPPFRTASTTMR